MIIDMEPKELKLIKGDFYTIVTESYTWIIQFHHQDRDYIYRMVSTNDQGQYNCGVVRPTCTIGVIQSIRKATAREINYLVNVAPKSTESNNMYEEYFSNVEPIFKTYI